MFAEVSQDGLSEKYLMTTMNFKGAMQLLVFVALFCYFILKIITAKNKLDAQDVGELISEREEDYVQGRVLCY